MAQLYFLEPHDITSKIVDIRARGLNMENPIDFGQDLAPENDLLGNSPIGVLKRILRRIREKERERIKRVE